MLSRLKCPLNHLRASCPNYAKWTYTESSPSLTRAAKLKRLNSENKKLFGATTKKSNKKEEANEEKRVEVPKVAVKNDNDISSEIYWMCGQKAASPVQWKTVEKLPLPEFHETPNPDDPLNIGGLMRKMEAQKSTHSPYSDEISDIKISKKVLNRKKFDQPQLPETLNKLHSSMPSSQIASTLSSDSDSDEEHEAKPIPLTTEHLRAIQNFPIVITKTNKTVSIFDDIDQFYHSVPSVSKVLQSTMPEHQRQALINWKNLKIAELGVEGFEELQKGHLKTGREFHQQLQNYFQGDAVDVLKIGDIWTSIEPFLGDFEVPATLIESKVRHPYLCYHGVVDCVSIHKSSLTVIEWKKSDRPKKSLNLTFDAPIQLVSYIGALNAMKEEFRHYPIRNGAVVVAYTDGQPADVFSLNENEMRKYWKLWLSRLQEYWVRYRDDTLPKEI